MLKRLTKEELFVSPANSSLVFILITIGEVTDIFVIVCLMAGEELCQQDNLFSICFSNALFSFIWLNSYKLVVICMRRKTINI